MEYFGAALANPVALTAAAFAVAATFVLTAFFARLRRRKAPTEARQVEALQVRASQTAFAEFVEAASAEHAAPAPEGPRLDPPVARPVASTGRRPVSVAAPNPNFTGRKDSAEEVAACLSPERMTVIHGTLPLGGLGKTALAEHVVHAALGEGRFTEGAIMIDLQGATGAPLSARDALYRLLGDVGVTVGAPPEGADERAIVSMLAFQWRRETNNRDLLVLFDNVRDVAQIEPLTPGRGATVLATSRARLGASDAKQVALDLFAPEEARSLVKKLIPDLPEDAAQRLVRLTPLTPLAVETATLAIARSTRAHERIVGEFAALPPGEIDERIWTLLNKAVDELDGNLAAAWSALSLFEGGFFADAAATLWGVTQDEADRWLNRLHHRRLVARTPLILPFEAVLGRRWRLHDALRPVAAARLAADPRSGDARFGWLRATTATVERAGRLYEVGGDGAAQGLALLDLELGDVISAGEEAAASVDRDNAAAEVAMRLPLWRILATRLDRETLARFIAAGVVGARRLGDHALERRFAAMSEAIAGRTAVAASQDAGTSPDEGGPDGSLAFAMNVEAAVEPGSLESEVTAPTRAEADADDAAPVEVARETAADEAPLASLDPATTGDSHAPDAKPDSKIIAKDPANPALRDAKAGRPRVASSGQIKPRLRAVPLEALEDDAEFRLGVFSVDEFETPAGGFERSSPARQDSGARGGVSK